MLAILLPVEHRQAASEWQVLKDEGTCVQMMTLFPDMQANSRSGLRGSRIARRVVMYGRPFWICSHVEDNRTARASDQR